MKRIILAMGIMTVSVLPQAHLPNVLVSGDRYTTSRFENMQYIYGREYRGRVANMHAQHAKILEQYRHDFGYTLHDKLYVGLASLHNQIANGFSTQTPFNAQMFYGAGSDRLDLFAASSWLKTLMVHESAHNYQLNARENPLSKAAHTVAGNTPFSMLGPLPVLPQPNRLIHPFFLEGNAVLNESRFGTGGRLYSGYTRAQNMVLARAGKITPARVYNYSMEYPYGAKRYLVGGAFQAFLARQYGIKKVNRFFRFYAQAYFRLSIDRAFREYYGKRFVDLLAAFKNTLLKEHHDFRPTAGTVLAHSDRYVPLSRIGNTVTTLISDQRSAPRILSVDTARNGSARIRRSNLPLGKLFRYRGRLLAQSSRYTAPHRITQGLFDEEAMLAKGTGSKVMLGTMPDGRLVYQDVRSSMDVPHIYIGGRFYDTASSRAFVDRRGNLYYFKQKGDRRILYRNKKVLYSFTGYYGFVRDVDRRGYVYFVSVSQHGSTLYRVKHGILQRVTDGDDVIDAKLLDDRRMLVANVTDRGFDYTVHAIRARPARIPVWHYGFENAHDRHLLDGVRADPDTAAISRQAYQPLRALRYSAWPQTFGYGSDGLYTNSYLMFYDPMMRNALWVHGYDSKTYALLGVGYNTVAHRVSYGASVEVRYDNQRKAIDHYGYSVYAKYPFLRSGYWRGYVHAGYRKLSYSRDRRFGYAGLSIENKKQFGIAKYPDAWHRLKLIAANDRGNGMMALRYDWMHRIGAQLYAALGAQYLRAHTADHDRELGIRLRSGASMMDGKGFGLDIPSFTRTVYAQEAAVAEAGLYKVWDASAYFYRFPLSIQRETLYGKYRRYAIRTAGKRMEFGEATLGIEVDVLLFHRATVPVGFALIHSSQNRGKNRVRVTVKTSF